MSPARLRSFWASCVRHMDYWFSHIAICMRIAKTSLNLSVSLWTLSFASLLNRRILLRWSSTQAWSQANTSIRWLLLQPTTNDPKLEAVCRISARMREEVLLGLLVFKGESYYWLGGGLTVICRCFVSRTMQFLSYGFAIFGWGNGNTTMSIVWACHCGIAVWGVFFLGLKSIFSNILQAFRNFARWKSGWVPWWTRLCFSASSTWIESSQACPFLGHKRQVRLFKCFSNLLRLEEKATGILVPLVSNRQAFGLSRAVFRNLARFSDGKSAVYFLQLSSPVESCWCYKGIVDNPFLHLVYRQQLSLRENLNPSKFSQCVSARRIGHVCRRRQRKPWMTWQCTSLVNTCLSWIQKSCDTPMGRRGWRLWLENMWSREYNTSSITRS